MHKKQAFAGFVPLQCAVWLMVVAASTGQADSQSTTTWSPITPIPGSIADGTGVALGTDGAGNSLTAWFAPASNAEDPSHHTVVTSRYTSAGGWTTPQVLEPNIPAGGGPWMAVNKAGAAVLVWTEVPPYFRARFFSPSAGWTASTPIDGDQLATNIHVAIDSNGVATVAWTRLDDFLSYTRRWEPNSGWQPIVQRSATPFGPLLTDGSGRMMSASMDPSTWTIHIQTLKPDGSFSDQTFPGVEPALAVNAGGDALLVARSALQPTDGTPDLFSRRYSSATDTWSPPVVITSTLDVVNVALTDDGFSAVLLYRIFGSARCEWRVLWSASALPGGAWSTPVQLSDENVNAVPSTLTVEPSGAIVAVWSQHGACDLTKPLVARRLPPNGQWDAVMPVNEPETGDGAPFAAATDVFGTTRIIWNQALNPSFPFERPFRMLSRWMTTSSTPTLTSIHTQLNPDQCLDVPQSNFSAGTPLILWQCNGRNNQRFHFVPWTGEIKTFDDSLCLDVMDGAASGNSIELWPCHGVNQKFSVTSVGELRVADSFCVDAAQAQSRDGTRVIAWTCHGGANQKWSIQTLGLRP